MTGVLSSYGEGMEPLRVRPLALVVSRRQRWWDRLLFRRRVTVYEACDPGPGTWSVSWDERGIAKIETLRDAEGNPPDGAG